MPSLILKIRLKSCLMGNTCIFKTWVVYLLSLAMLLASFTKVIFLVFSLSPCNCHDSTYCLLIFRISFFYLKWHNVTSNQNYVIKTLYMWSLLNLIIAKLIWAVPWLRQLVPGLSPPGFDPGSVHVGFVVDKVALGQVFPRVFRFSPVNFIPPVLHYKDKWKNTNHLHHRVAQ
jgi:hypothetical protein